MDPIIIQKYTLPLLVPGVNETDDQWSARWKKFDTLSENVKDRLADEKSMKIIQHLGERASFDLEQVAFLARAVRLYYFGELSLEGFADYFVQNIGVAPMTAQKIAQTLIAQVIKKTVKETKERMTLRVALDRFHELKNQTITDGGLMVAGAQRRRPGTIENWITDYHLAIGQGKHTAIERGNYLFHNRNTKALSAADRQKVAMVLKSFDEDMVMVIDTARGEVVFPKAQKIPQRTGIEQEVSTSHAQLQPKRQPKKSSQPVAQNRHAQQVQKGDIIKKHSQQRIIKNTNASDTQPIGYVNFSSGQRLSREKK